MPARDINNSRTRYMPTSEQVQIALVSHHRSTAWIPEARYDCDIDQAQRRNGVCQREYHEAAGWQRQDALLA